VMGNVPAAQAFNRVWQERLALVQQRLVGAPAGPSVFLESRVGLSEQCCESLVGMLGKLVDAAGGQNLAKGLIPGEHGILNPEMLLTRQPQIYIGTAVGSLSTLASAPERIVLGAGVSEAVARRSLQRSLQRPAVQALQAVRQGRAYALWHHFYNSPFNVVALEVLAKWLYPQRFADVQPRRTLEQMYAQFQPIALQGEYWVSLQP
jgi:iron complex transport system substrate-binding protein